MSKMILALFAAGETPVEAVQEGLKTRPCRSRTTCQHKGPERNSTVQGGMLIEQTFWERHPRALQSHAPPDVFTAFFTVQVPLPYVLRGEQRQAPLFWSSPLPPPLCFSRSRHGKHHSTWLPPSRAPHWPGKLPHFHPGRNGAW